MTLEPLLITIGLSFGISIALFVLCERRAFHKLSHSRVDSVASRDVKAGPYA